MGHQTRRDLILYDLEDKVNSFCKLTMKEMVDGEQATAARFVWHLAIVREASGSALASRSSSTATPCSPQASPWFNCFAQQ
jgi:hypothetical protein